MATALPRWPDGGMRSPGGGYEIRAQKTSRYYFSNGGGRDGYIYSIGSEGKVQRPVAMFHEGKDRYNRAVGGAAPRMNRPLRRNESPDLASAATLPSPKNPCFGSRGVACLISSYPRGNKFRPQVRREAVQARPSVAPLATDKITEFSPPSTLCKRPGDVSLADEPSASFAGHIPRSPKTPRRRVEVAELRLPPRIPENSPASGRVKAKILGYTGHVPNRRYDLDSRAGGQGRVWESPA